MQIRLQKWLALSGAASRRKAEAYITAGRVCVNGHVVSELGAKADTECDVVTLDQKRLVFETKKMYIMLNKPEGVVTTVTDPQGRSTVMDYVKTELRLYPVGRLDYDTGGLLIMTNDGDFAQKMTHPSHKVRKTYVAEVKGKPASAAMMRFREGLMIEGERTAPAEIKMIETKRMKDGSDVSKMQIVLYEGRNRQVRKMCDAIGHPVLSLKRIAIGTVKLSGLGRGQWRELTKQELKSLGVQGC